MLFGKKKETLAVQGMTCAHCEQSMEKGLAEIERVVKVKADADGNVVEVFYKGEAPDMDAVRQKIVALGFEPVDG